MLTKIKVFKPLPAYVHFNLSRKNIEHYFDYKKYTNMSTIAKNLEDKDILFGALDVFSRNLYEYRNVLYYNLETLEIERLISKKIHGMYLLNENENICYFTHNELATVYHELIHVASTYLDKKNKILHSGFAYCSLNGKISFGEGLTEGYVEFLCSKHLNKDDLIYQYNLEKKTFDIPPYFYANILVRQLEIIVGEQNLKDMFFKEGFFKLKDFLLQYKDEKEVLEFFRNCDIAAVASEENNLILNKSTLRAQKFLTDICLEHMPEKYSELQELVLYKSNIGLSCDKVSKQLDNVFNNQKNK